MRIAQIVLPDASEYERKSQRIDHAIFAVAHDVNLVALDDIHNAHADVAHIYASSKLPPSQLVGFPIPYIANADIARTRWPFRKPAVPDYVVSPLIEKVEQSRFQPLPEAVEDAYFQWAVSSEQWAEAKPQSKSPSSSADCPLPTAHSKVIGTFGPARQNVASLVERTLVRIHRMRDDVEWQLFDHVPSPNDLRTVDLWVDPASDEADLDGFVAEAIACEIAVVATRTPINNQRLEKGRTGFLVPCNDPNELAHAILGALFKPEVAQRKIEAARQTASKFRPRQRFRILSHLYETLIS